MEILKKTTSGLPPRGRKRLSLKIAGIEYRVAWNEGARGWDVLRNGDLTVSGRKKRKSAMDCAIRDAKAELESAGTSIAVTCLTGGKLETLWKMP